MNCVINDVIDNFLRKGKKIAVIRRFIRLKYRIYIDSAALKERIKSLNLEYEYELS